MCARVCNPKTLTRIEALVHNLIWLQTTILGLGAYAYTPKTLTKEFPTKDQRTEIPTQLTQSDNLM